MKLRRRRKEKEKHRVLRYHPVRPWPEPAPALLPSSFPFSLPPPSPTSPHPPPPQLPLRHGSGERCPPATLAIVVPLLPFFFIKLLKQQSVERRTEAGTYLADPAVLSNDNIAAPSSPATLAPSSNWVAAAPLRFQWHPLHSGWSHRETKTENELSYFITFIDE